MKTELRSISMNISIVTDRQFVVSLCISLRNMWIIK